MWTEVSRYAVTSLRRLLPAVLRSEVRPEISARTARRDGARRLRARGAGRKTTSTGRPAVGRGDEDEAQLQPSKEVKHPAAFPPPLPLVGRPGDSHVDGVRDPLALRGLHDEREVERLLDLDDEELVTLDRGDVAVLDLAPHGVPLRGKPRAQGLGEVRLSEAAGRSAHSRSATVQEDGRLSCRRGSLLRKESTAPVSYSAAITPSSPSSMPASTFPCGSAMMLPP